MKCYWLETQANLTTDELASEGIPNETIRPEPGIYQNKLTAWMRERDYQVQDEIKLDPDTPHLEQMLDRFVGEHLHTDDEVRYIVSGAGIFDIRSRDDCWMRIEVSAGDFIIVPANVYHRFTLTAEKTIHVIRLFKDNPFWEPVYRKVSAP